MNETRAVSYGMCVGCMKVYVPMYMHACVCRTMCMCVFGVCIYMWGYVCICGVCVLFFVHVVCVCTCGVCMCVCLCDVCVYDYRCMWSMYMCVHVEGVSFWSQLFIALRICAKSSQEGLV